MYFLLPLVSVAYLAVLFGVATWGDSRAFSPKKKSRILFDASFLYAMTFAIHNTSWSFFGFPEQYIRHEYVYIATYAGPALLLLVGGSALSRIISIAKQQRAISIADFIACRYGKRQYIATLVTIVCLFAIIPYISIQLKIVGKMLGHIYEVGDSRSISVYLLPALAASVMALFSCVFGVRHVRGHHHGMMLSVAFESGIKLVLFSAIFVSAFAFLDRPLFSTEAVTTVKLGDAPHIWIMMALFGMAAFMCMPHMYYAVVVANPEFFRTDSSTILDAKQDIQRNKQRLNEAAAWYIVYIVCLVILVLVLTLMFSNHEGKCYNGSCIGSFKSNTIDEYIPVLVGQLGIFGKIAGAIVCIAAATGMTIVASIATSTMICNVIVMPVVGWIKRTNTLKKIVGAPNEYKLLLDIRRMAILFIFALAFGVQVAYSSISDSSGGVSWSTAELGLLSFMLATQLAPSFFIGLYWPRGHHTGVMAGLIAGIVVAVTYIAAVPPGARPGDAVMLTAITTGGIWSLLANSLVYVLVSHFFSWWERLAGTQSELDAVQARAFVYGQSSRHKFLFRRIEKITVKDLRKFMADFGPDAARLFEQRNALRVAEGRRAKDNSEVDYELILDMHDIIADVRGPIRAIRYIVNNLHVNGVTAEELEHILAEALGSRAEDPDGENTPKKPDVFICYAIDDEKLKLVSDFLKRHDLLPRTLEHDATQSRPILERLPDYTDVAYAIALFTPTDLGARKGEELGNRARQNVVFELGYFLGCLGKSRVCVIRSGGGMEVPSNMDGVVMLDFDEKGNVWEAKLLREIKAAGVLPSSAKLRPPELPAMAAGA